MATAPAIMNIHTPSQSFAIVHSIKDENLQILFHKVSRKAHAEHNGEHVGPGWLKYAWNAGVWNLDDDADYTIFVWRQQNLKQNGSSTDLRASPVHGTGDASSPTLYLRNPRTPLPEPPAYRNPSFYLFQPDRAVSPSQSSMRSSKSRKAKEGKNGHVHGDGVGFPKYRKEFEKFHSENGVRTVMGSIGPVQNVRMLLKNGHRHVYISRKFAMKHGFIPADAAPGHYGYGGLVNIGTWPITLTPSTAFANDQGANRPKPKPVHVEVYLSEEPHFDVVLGRSFFEKRQIKVSPIDPTDVVCLDTGEKVECELVILKDGKGEIVTVT